MKINKKRRFLICTIIACISSVFGGYSLNRNVLADNPNNGAKNAYFLSTENITVTDSQPDTKGVVGTKVVLDGVQGKEKVTINYGNYLSKDELSQDFLEMSFMPQENGKKDFDAMIVTVSDAIDETKKICYVVAPEPDVATWWPMWTAAWMSYTDEITLATKATYGHGAVCYVTGTSQNIYGYNNSFLNQYQPEWDGVTKYFAPGYNLGYNSDWFVRSEDTVVLQSLRFSLFGSQALINDKRIADLTDEQFMSRSNAGLKDTKYEYLYTAENFENKFSSGYCKLSISFLGCNSNQIECHFKKIGAQVIKNQDGQSIQNGTPYIEVAHNTNAIVGKTFTFPKTKILDMREGDISDKATFRFFNVNKEEILGDENGVVFSQPGDYKMQVSVRLETGEEFYRVYPIECFEKKPKTIFEIDTTNFSNNYKTGDILTIPNAVATNQLSTRDDKRVELAVKLFRNGIVVQTFNNDYTQYYSFKEAGSYVLSYVYSDGYGENNAETFLFNVEESIGFLPDYLPVSITSGVAIQLGDCKLENYVNNVNSNELYRAIYINDEQVYLAKGDTPISGALSITKDFGSASEVMISYRAGFSQNQLDYEKSFRIPVIKPLYIEDYLIVENGAGEYTREDVETISSADEIIFKTSKPHIFTMPQVLSLEDFSVSFDVKAAYSGADTFNLRLRDYYDSTKSILLTVSKKSNTASLLYVNGVYQSAISGSFINDSSYFDWAYDTKFNYVTNSLGVALTKRFSTWSDGRAFDGFTDNLAVLSFELTELAGEAAFSIRRVNNQSLFTTEFFGQKQAFTDTSAPNIKLYGEIDKKDFAMGAQVYLPKARAFDVLSPNTTIYLSVVAPNGTYIYEAVDISKEYLLTIDSFGKWEIIYYAFDASGIFRADEKYVIDVQDTVAPKLYIKGSIVTTAKLNQTLTFPEAEVFDNVKQNCEYYILISDPNGVRKYLKDRTYTFREKGRYIVRYYTYDDYMNITQYIFEIQVG